MNPFPATSRLTLGALVLTLGLAACGGGTAPDSGTPPVTQPPGETAVTSLADSGPGSLRAVLAAAPAGATLRLSAAGTVTLASPLAVTKNVTLILTGGVLDAAGKGRVLEVSSGAAARVQGGTLRGGVGAALPENAGAPGAPATYGGVVLNRGDLTLDGVTVTGGRANLGGGVASVQGSTLTLSGSASIQGNRADGLGTAFDQISGYGGGVHARGATLKLSGGTVSGNTAFDCGGGVDVRGAAASTVELSGTRVSGNTAGVGAGVCLDGRDGGPLQTRMTGGAVADNTARFWGGGLYNSGTLTLSGGEVTGNTGAAGGGLYTDRAAAVTLSGGTLRDNRAVGSSQTYTIAARGGGVSLQGTATLNLAGTAITANTAGTAGGGLSRASTTTLSGSTATVTGNAPDNIFNQP